MIIHQVLLDFTHESAVQMDNLAAAAAAKMQMLRALQPRPHVLVILLLFFGRFQGNQHLILNQTVEVPVDGREIDLYSFLRHSPVDSRGTHASVRLLFKILQNPGSVSGMIFFCHRFLSA